VSLRRSPDTEIDVKTGTKGELALGHCLLDNEMRITWMDKKMEEWFGGISELYGRKCYRWFSKSFDVCTSCPALKVLGDRKKHILEIKSLKGVNGRLRYYRIAATPIASDDGTLDSVLLSYADITEERKKKNIERRRSARAKLINGEIKKISGFFKKVADKRTAKLRLATKELDTIYQLGNRLISSLDVGEILSSIVRIVPDLLGLSGCIVRILDEKSEKLKIEASSGLGEKYENEARYLSVGEGISGTVVLKRRPLAVTNVSANDDLKYRKECAKENIRSFLAVPIMFKSKILGVIIAFSRKVRHFNVTETNLLSSFAAHAAIALNNALIYKQLHYNYYNTIMTLVKTIEARDPYTCGHSERVTNYAVKLARRLQLSGEDIETLAYAGKLHDIGKIAVPDYILRKTSSLTAVEWAKIEAHPIKGTDLVMNLDFLKRCIPLIRHHHERFDGNGYPDRLKSHKIPYLARILSIADSFDAMTSERPYRRSLTIAEAMEEIKQNVNAQFDPELSRTFLSILKEHPDSTIAKKGWSKNIELAS